LIDGFALDRNPEEDGELPLSSRTAAAIPPAAGGAVSAATSLSFCSGEDAQVRGSAALIAPKATRDMNEARALARVVDMTRRTFMSRAAGTVAASTVPAAFSAAGSAAPGAGARTPPPLARRLADYICNVRYEDLDPRAVERAKEHLIYHVGLAFGGALTGHGRQAVMISNQLSGDCGSATIIGHRRRASPLDAAFANSTFIRALGFDDVLFPSATHAGLLTYPAALAVGEQYRATGRELLTAIVTGYEVLGKLVLEEEPGRTPRRPSMPFGPFAGATAAARLMRLTPDQAANAIGYAADGAMGLKEGNEQQPTHIYGLISRTAMMAAYLAKAGGETADTILEGKYGYFATILGVSPDPDQIVHRLGKDPEILRATQKRYPGTALNIVPIQLLLDLLHKHQLTAATVKHVEFELPEDRRTFEDSTSLGPFPTYTQAASSLPFQAAIILIDGRVDTSRYSQRENAAILEVVKKVSIRLAPHKNSRFARVRLTTTDERTFQAEGHDYVFPPLDAAEWLSRDGSKFVSSDRLFRFSSLIRDLENVRNVGELMMCLRPA
jgi:2-methylcitrate dehydratase PrpD